MLFYPASCCKITFIAHSIKIEQSTIMNLDLILKSHTLFPLYEVENKASIHFQMTVELIVS